MRRIVLLAVGLLMIGRLTDASPIQLGLFGVGKAQVVTLSGVRDVTAYAGELDWAWDGYSYSSFVDVLNTEHGRAWVNVRDTEDALTSTALTKAAWLFDSFAVDIHTSGSSAMAAGLQLAIWEVLYDSQYDLSSGGLRVASASSDALKYGTSYLQAVTNAGSYRPASKRLRDPDPVPEPATLTLLAMGLAGLAARRKRFINPGAGRI